MALQRLPQSVRLREQAQLHGTLFSVLNFVVFYIRTSEFDSFLWSRDKIEGVASRCDLPASDLQEVHFR